MTIFNKITWRIFHFVFLSPFYTLFLLLSPTDNTSKAYSTNPLWNRAALLYITLLWVQLPVHIICVHVWMSMQWIEYRWWSSKGSYPSISNPRSIRLLLSSSLPSPPFPFNLCRQGRHQSEWQVVWSSSWAWWEKERCQHKYPSWIQADMEHPRPPWIFSHDHRRQTSPSPENATLSFVPLHEMHDWYGQFNACPWLSDHLFPPLHRLIASAQGLLFLPSPLGVYTHIYKCKS